MLSEEQKCPVCFTEAGVRLTEDRGNVTGLECPRCGGFSVARGFKEIALGESHLGPINSRMRGDLSAWIRSQQSRQITLSMGFFTDASHDIGRIAFESARAQVRTFHDRANELLKNLAKLSEYSAGRGMEVSVAWVSLCWACDQGELSEILRYLDKVEHLQHLPASRHYRIDHAGWAHLEELKKTNPDSEQGFVAMSFDDSMNEAYEKGLKPAIEAAGWRPYRIDRDHHNEMIDNKIIAEIKQSRFVVTDLTDHKYGAYFEAGLAMGLGLPVFWTCEDSDFGQAHFDIRQFNRIKWKKGDWDALIEDLSDTIKAVIGRGTYKPDAD